ncbi:MAG TPA: ATP-binding protein, partial [Gammaproteobacteria bacterium]|nr:ATP-binding protein [Gammaproteobacteria bacterium]
MTDKTASASKSISLRQLVLIIAILPATVLALLMGIYFTGAQLNDLTRSYRLIGEHLTDQLATLSEYPLYTGDKAALQKIANTLLRDNQVALVEIHDANGLLLAKASAQSVTPAIINASVESNLKFTRRIQAMNPQPSQFDALLTEPVVRSTKADKSAIPILGTVSVVLAQQNILNRRNALLLRGALIVSCALGLIFLLAWQVSKYITRPLEGVIHATRQFRDGALNTRVDANSLGELRDLQAGFNAMADSVQEAQDKLQEEIGYATKELQQTLEAVEIKNVELDLARKRAIAASHIKSEFLANMSHEIRTPMNAIVGFTQLMEKTPLDADQQDYLRTIKQSADTLLKLLEDVLNLSRIEAGKLHLEEHPFSPAQLAENSLQMIAGQAYQKQLELVCKVDNGLPETVLGDSGKLQQILINLLFNAVKFTAQGTVSLHISAGRQDSNHRWLNFTVSDTGAGISRVQQDQLFQPFTQLENTATKSYGGAGLGLVICRKLAETMQGDITLESRPGVGSTFIVSLPFGSVAEAALPAKSLYTGLHVALYERHPAAATALRQRLQSLGMTVWQTTRLDKLLEELKTTQADADKAYDFVILSLDHSETRYGDNLYQLWDKLDYPPKCLILANTVEKGIHRRFERTLGGVCLPKFANNDTLLTGLAQLFRDGTPRKELDESQELSPSNLQGKTVLVIEDNRINRKLITEMLRQLKADIQTAETGKAALDIIALAVPDCILLDMHLPDTNGFEILQKLQSMQCKATVIVLTASSDPELAAQAIQEGARSVLVKPV